MEGGCGRAASHQWDSYGDSGSPAGFAGNFKFAPQECGALLLARSCQGVDGCTDCGSVVVAQRGAEPAVDRSFACTRQQQIGVVLDDR